MAKAKKVRGVKVFLNDAEVAGLNRLLQYGVDYSTRTALGLDGVADEVNLHAGWKSFPDFTVKASTEPQEDA